MAVTHYPRDPGPNVHEIAARQTFGSGGVDFRSSNYSVSGQMGKQGHEVDVTTPGQITAGAKGALTVMATRDQPGLMATGKAGSSIDFMKMQ